MINIFVQSLLRLHALLGADQQVNPLQIATVTKELLHKDLAHKARGSGDEDTPATIKFGNCRRVDHFGIWFLYNLVHQSHLIDRFSDRTHFHSGFRRVWICENI